MLQNDALLLQRQKKYGIMTVEQSGDVPKWLKGPHSKTATLQPSAKPAKALVFKGFGLI